MLKESMPSDPRKEKSLLTALEHPSMDIFIKICEENHRSKRQMARLVLEEYIEQYIKDHPYILNND